MDFEGLDVNIEETREQYPAEEINTIGFIQPVDTEMPEGVLTVSKSSEIQGTLEETVPEKSQEEVIREMVANPQIKANALANANDIRKKCKGWFRLQDAARKLMMKPEVMLDILNILGLFEMCYRREHKGDMRFKIILSNDDKLTVKREELTEAEAKVEKLKEEIRELCERQAAEIVTKKL